jgi:hypothetical protein
MKKEDFEKARSIQIDINTHMLKIAKIQKVLQIDPAKEGEDEEIVLLKEAYFVLPKPHRHNLIAEAIRLLEACMKETESLIEIKKKEFEAL